MPVGRPTPLDDSGSLGEQLLGRGDKKRAPKTFIEDGPLAMYLGLVRSMPQSLINTGRRLHAEEKGMKFDDVSAEMIVNEYPEILELIELHQQIVEHKGSQGGFLVDRFVQRTSQEEMEKREKEKNSSGESKGSGNKRWT